MNLYFPRRRLFVVFVFVIFLFTAVLFKLFYVQILDSANLQALAAEQWMRDVPLTASRGVIYDRNEVVLANTSTTYTVYVRPNAVSEAEAVAEILSSKLGLDYYKLLAKIKTGKVSEITVAKKIDKKVMQIILSSGLDGIYFSADTKRYYPYGDFMTQLLGFTNYDGIGQSGLESYYNTYLQGVNGYVLTESDLIGRELSDNVTTKLYSCG
jgi:stage V sporulation protein D (sporulation-specific penicillin-binding protein)